MSIFLLEIKTPFFSGQFSAQCFGSVKLASEQQDLHTCFSIVIIIILVFLSGPVLHKLTLTSVLVTVLPVNKCSSMFSMKQ